MFERPEWPIELIYFLIYIDCSDWITDRKVRREQLKIDRLMVIVQRVK